VVVVVVVEQEGRGGAVEGAEAGRSWRWRRSEGRAPSGAVWDPRSGRRIRGVIAARKNNGEGVG
jgi:hypothetical protein